MRRELTQLVMGIVVCAVVGSGCGMKDAEGGIGEKDAAVVEATAIVAGTEDEQEMAEETLQETEVVTEQETECASEIVAEAATEIQTDVETESETEAETIVEESTEAETEAPVVYTYTELSATMYAKSSVNVRNLPCVDGNKVGSLSTNDEVTVLGQCNETGWYKIAYKNAEAFVSNNYLVTEKVVVQATANADTSGHNYYKNLSAEQAAEADAVAKAIADAIMADAAYTTDLERVNAAAEIVAAYCYNCAYGTDANKWYRSPYGVFVGGVYTCAGSTRALGRVLDFMGYSWQHMNPNQNTHQWCVLTMDGQVGFADGMGGFAGYGEMVSGMTLPDGRMIFF